MDFEDLLKFIELEEGRSKKHYNGKLDDKEKYVLSSTVKLTEELGELCNEVLSAHSLQRKQKQENRKDENLPKEFADVIIITLILARAMNVDIEKALERRMEEINKRYE